MRFMPLIAACPLVALGLAQGASKPIDSFTIHEAFGVSHPKQIIDFDLHSKVDAAAVHLVGPDGGPAPFQILRDGKLAVETDLPASSERTWNLYAGSGAPAIADNAVAVKTAPGWYEITNGLTGVRVTRQNNLAPVQGILYRDRVWTGLGPNYLLDARDSRLEPKTFEVRFLEKGPLKTVVEADYTFARPDLIYGGKLLIPGGSGYYHCTIELQAGQPSILVEEDTDMDLRYQFVVSHGLDPDQARYRGHHSTSIANGRQADGRVYGEWHERPAQDAIVDLRYDPPAPSCYTSTAPCIRRMAIWDPWVFDSGWYWMLYNSRASGGANLLGIFAGRASEAIGAAFNGPGVYTAKEASGGHAAGIRLETNRRGPDARVYPRVRLCWGIFVGVKGLDLGDPLQVQNIARQMNLHGGINLNKIHRYALNAENERGDRRVSPLYMNSAAVERVAARVHSDDVYYRHLYNSESTARPLLDLWHEASTKRREDVVKTVSRLAHDLLDQLVNGDGIYSFTYHYWHGGLEMSRQAVWINAILASPQSSPADRATVEAAAVLFASILWDNDFVPLFDGHGLNLGTANMPVQQTEYRDLYALLLSGHPMMRGRVDLAVRNALSNLHETVSETGAAMGSTHYIGAAMGPLLSTLQQIQTAGVGDPFRDESRLGKFARFYMNLLTPAEPRFGDIRKVVAIGDASTESSEMYGQMATGFAGVNPELSAQLMWAWNRSGAVHSGFHATTVLKIDDSLPAKDPELHDATFPGWYSVLRNGWRTKDETAIWLVNGDFYRDHAHEDNGNVAIYALGAPLSLDWGSMYSPQAPGAVVHNAPIPESRLKFRWDADNTPLENDDFRWAGATQEAFESFADGAHTRASYHLADGLVWRRSVYSIHPDAAHPILVIRDKFEGAGAAAPKILSMNLVASGAVATPAGPVTPPIRIWGDDKHAALPSVTPVQKLGPGVHEFEFSGQSFGGKPAIDCDVFLVSANPVEALVGNWGHRWHPNQEQNEFRQANGRPFEESQHILRLRGTGEFELILVPQRKGETRQVTAVQQGSKLIVKAGDETTTFDEDSYSWHGSAGSVVASFGAGAAAADGISVSGGPAEVVMSGGDAQVTMHGAAGQRTVRLPNGLIKSLDYAGGEPVTWKSTHSR
jgi:hypothetical protein